MDGERVIGSPSEEAVDDEGTGRDVNGPTLTYTKVFNDVFPYYLSIGMSADEFWRGDVFLAKAYRKAQKLREDMMNQQYWLQGMYFYEAICDASPIFNPYAKRGTKPHPYPSEPYTIHAPTKKQQENKEREQMDKLKKAMDMYATKVNSKYMKPKEVSTDNG